MAATQADHMHEVATHELYDHNTLETRNSTLPNGTEKRSVNTTEKGKYIHNFTHLENNQFHELNNAMPVMQNESNDDISGGKSDDDARHNYQRDVYNHVENNQMHLANNVDANQYGFQNMRHHYPKGVRSQTNQNINSHNNYIPQQVHPPQRIMSGQSISQQMGPTPTLNQLLQSSNPVHRYQNNYAEYGKPNDSQNSAFNHNWNSRPYLPPQQPTATYRNPSPNVSRNNSPGNGPPSHLPPQTPSNTAPYPPAGNSTGPPGNYPPLPQASASPPQQYPPYPQRYPTPPSGSTGPVRVPAYPPSHHQIGPYGPYPGDGRPPWPPSQQIHAAQPQPPQQPTQIPPVSPLSSAPSTPSSTTAQQHSPQRSLPSPQTVNHPEPSPQHQPQQSPQHQSQMMYGNRRPHSSLTPEPGDVTSQNSNDSTSGGPQAMRPTPSPTGSSSSRSMSPAIGQQNLSMPPRPSSGQSDTGSTSSQSRLSQSPMTNQGGYQQQPLAPPPHMHPYKMSHAPPPGSMHSTSISPATPPGAPNYQSQIPQPHQQFPHQGNYMVRPPYQNFPLQPQSNQFPGRPVANHMPQFGNYQSWPGPNMNATPGSVPLSLGGSVSPSSNHVTSPPMSGKTVPSPTSSPQQHHQPQPVPTSSSNAHQMHMQQHLGPNGSPNIPPANSPSSRSHTPPQYLKQHLQHKVGFNSGLQPSSPGGSPMYGRSSPTGMGPPHHHGHQMGPPHHHSQMGLSPSSHDPSMAPPPSSTPLQHMQVDENAVNDPSCMLTTTVNAVNATNVSQVNSGTITSVITTGPDGASVDEASQQSTLSNTSAASGDDPSLTPKRKESSSSTSSMNMMMPMGNFLGHTGHSQSHIMPPGSPASSGINSIHDDYSSDVNSPWSRPPTSPVFNSHNMSQDIYRSKKHDSLSKLYEMDDNPERRIWLDKLLQFMEDRGSPISATPTISKNPLDLFRLYVYVKERGGFIEVCKVQCSSTVTKNKIWKDIAGLLGIGASSSAAYTLRKHYTKNLLPFECHFDRGGIDPEPIINQLETSTKKKGPKTASVPSPGSSNSQDSFPSPAPNMDGYSNYSYPSDFNNQRPPPPHQNSQGLPGQPGGYQGQPGYSQYPPTEQYGQQYHMTPNSYPPSRPAMYPVYPPDAPDRGYSQNNNNSVAPPVGPQAPPMQPNQSDAYGRGYNQPNYPTRPPYNSSTGQTSPPSTAPSQNAQAPPSPTSIPQNYPPSPQHQQPSTPPPTQPQPRTPPPQQQPLPNQQPPPQPVSQDYYKPDQPIYQNQPQPPPVSSYPGVPTKGMPPPGAQIPQQPRRHPDFAKEQQQQQQQQQPQPPYPPYNNQQRPVYGWTNGPNNQYRPTYPVNQTNGPQQWPPAQGPPPPQRPPLPNPQTMPNAQWDQNRYPPNSQSFAPPPPQVSASGQWNMSTQGPAINHSTSVRSPRPSFRPDSKPYPPMSTQGPLVKSGVSGQPLGGNQMVYGTSTAPLKRELTFPPDSVESVTPVLYKRRKLVRSDVAPVDAWKLMMSLRSGLLSETTWALDVLNILLYDEVGIQYFGLNHLPGLLDILMEHFNKSLSEMLVEEDEEKVKKCRWYERVTEETMEPDLGRVKEIDASESIKISNLPDYTLKSRRGIQGQYVDASNDLFIKDGKRDWDKKQVTMDDIIAPDTGYIVHCFKSEYGIVPFVRVMKGKSASSSSTLADERRRRSSKRIKEEKVEGCNEEELIKKEKEEEEEEEINDAKRLEEKLSENGCNIRDPFGVLKRKKLTDYEDECYTRDEASLYLVNDTQDSIARRCICISTILRNLTFVPGNELEFAKCPGYLALMGKLLLIHHEHPLRAQKQRNYDREEDLDFSDCCSSLQAETEWWWDFLHQIRENVLVSIANIAGYVDFSIYTEEVSRPVLDGLLHWAICPAAQGQDAFPTAHCLSPQRLALEALCKLCVTDSNVDLVIATPPYSRLERLTSVLTKLLCRNEEQVLREFAVNLLHYLAAADSIMSRVIALQSPCVSLLVAFIEQAEQSALSVANQHGINALRDNPESMGTSLDMLRRAARTLLHLSKHPDNIPLFLQQEQRLLALVMSQILDQQVAAIISQVLYQCSRNPTSRSR